MTTFTYRKNRPIRFRVVFLMILLLSNCSAYSSELFSLDGIDIYIKPNEIIKGIPDDSHLIALDVTIGKDSLDDVQAKLGKSEILSRKEHAPNKICYVSKQNNGLNIVIFEAGALGGWKTVTGFSFHDNNYEFDEREVCKDSSLVLKPVQTNSGIKLGMSIKELRGILGKPSKTLENEVIYVYRGKRRMSSSELDNVASLWPEARKNPFFDVTSMIVAEFHGSRMMSYKANKIESFQE